WRNSEVGLHAFSPLGEIAELCPDRINNSRLPLFTSADLRGSTLAQKLTSNRQDHRRVPRITGSRRNLCFIWLWQDFPWRPSNVKCQISSRPAEGGIRYPAGADEVRQSGKNWAIFKEGA